jgi:hypothetical protein
MEYTFALHSMNSVKLMFPLITIRSTQKGGLYKNARSSGAQMPIFFILEILFRNKDSNMSCPV